MDNNVRDRSGLAVSGKKVMTPVSCLNEICMVRKLSLPDYYESSTGFGQTKMFTMVVWVRDMELRETGHGKTKMEAKHEAATRVLDTICIASERNVGLYVVSSQVVKKCHEMLKKVVITEPQRGGHRPTQSGAARTSLELLRSYEIDRGLKASTFRCVNVFGPPNRKQFLMTCKQGDYITRGTGKSMQIGNDMAASQMLKILSESTQANPQENMFWSFMYTLRDKLIQFLDWLTT